MSENMESYLGCKDPRMAAYPLMDNPKTTVILAVMYLLFVKVIGPKWMKDRAPYELRIAMVTYNALLVALSLWIVLNLGIYGWFAKYSWRCEPIDFSSKNVIAVKMAQVCWVFYVSKLVEFCDTIFFVLRKKNNQINFLHVFHHSTVPITAWYGASYGPGGYNTIFAIANSFVHIWMYLYYGLAAFGPGIQKYLWWKKYLTALQLTQFFFVFGYFSQLYLFPLENCKVSTFLLCLSLGQAIIYFMLFTHFYLNSYKRNPRRQHIGYKASVGKLEQQNGNTRTRRKKEH